MLPLPASGGKNVKWPINIMAAVSGQKLVHCNKNIKTQVIRECHNDTTSGHKRTPKQLALIIKRCLPMVLTGSGMPLHYR
ncbi:hypothetical protein [Escherichia coli]|uniref:hypothetical protein n=1 Tax=Escherichia coli TaxID=562 RepID=UPI003EBB1AFC